MGPQTLKEFSKYLAVPYADKGRTLEGWDCYGLYRYLQAERHGIELPSWDDSYTSAEDGPAVAASMGERLGSWVAVPLGSEQEGDGIVFRLGGIPWHCGYVIEPGIMLHALQGRMTAIERYNSHLWQKRIEGIYRWKS
jgi:cell wall-associated NlpC family hydrolase